MYAWLSFHIWFTIVGWFQPCFLAKIACHAWYTATHTHRKNRFNILIGYPQARMCVWAKQEECYFWSPVVVLHICACQHKLIHVVAWMQGTQGLKLQLGMCLTLISTQYASLYALLSILTTKLDNVSASGCGELQHSIWRSRCVSQNLSCTRRQ